MSFPVGSLIRVSVTFQNVNGIATDPGAVTFRIVTPSGTDTTYTYGQPDGMIVKDGVGRYHADVSANAEGRWRYRFAGTTPVQSADEGFFRVRESSFV
jgi:hypothetical protein